jgi:isopropylmalate/homocitrate/citramalate synthase
MKMDTNKKGKMMDWFVSPWNFMHETLENVAFPREIKLHDVTLRDGEQQAGIVFTKDEKVRIAGLLAEAGVHRIEAGMPAVSPSDEAAIKEIVKLKLGPQIFAFARCMKEDIQRAADCGVEGVIVEIPSSEHIIEYAYRWPLSKAMDLSIEATRFAKELGLYVVFFPIDATRADLEQYLSLIENVAKNGHIDALCLVDTFGTLSPHAVPFFVRETQKRITCPLETHFHMDFGHGVTNTILALACGAQVAHTTVSGIGERAGNVPMEELALSLLMQYGIDIGVRTSKLMELSRTVIEYAGVQIPPNRPVVGERLYQIESGIISGWLMNCKDEHITEVFPYHWDVVGQKPAELVLGKGSGLPSISYWLDRLQISTSEDERMAILTEVKAVSLRKKGLLDEAEFRRVVTEIIGR